MKKKGGLVRMQKADDSQAGQAWSWRIEGWWRGGGRTPSWFWQRTVSVAFIFFVDVLIS